MTKTTKKKPAPVKQQSKGNIILCWCDGGMVDGKFAEGLVYTLLTTTSPIKSAMRVQGNQIGRQRQNAFEYWYDKTDFEWILWVDSDIEITKEVIEALWDVADPVERPCVSGIYFISKENEQSVMTPFPAVFQWTDDPHTIQYIHPLPKDSLIKVGAAGFGLLLMHRSVAKRMIEKHGRIPFFNETGVGQSFVSEDINFFRLMWEADVPLFAHTGALVKHYKRFAYDVGFYKLFWDNYETHSKPQT